MENKFKIIADVCRMIPKDEPITYSRLATLFEQLAKLEEKEESDFDKIDSDMASTEQHVIFEEMDSDICRTLDVPHKEAERCINKWKDKYIITRR